MLWCVLSPKGQHILLIDLSHAAEREGHKESSFNCGFRGLFPMWWCHSVSKLSLQGACTLSEGLSIVPAHIFLLSLDPLLTMFPSSLAFIFSHLVQALSQHFPWVCPSSALWIYPFHLSFFYNIYFSAVYQHRFLWNLISPCLSTTFSPGFRFSKSTDQY